MDCDKLWENRKPALLCVDPDKLNEAGFSVNDSSRPVENIQHLLLGTSRSHEVGIQNTAFYNELQNASIVPERHFESI